MAKRKKKLINIKGFKHKYTDEHKQEAMEVFLANGCNYAITARELGMPVGTLRLWVEASPAIHAVVSKHKNRFQKTAWAVLNDSLGKLRKRVNSKNVSTEELVKVINCLFEKNQLMALQPTAISASHEHHTSDRRGPKRLGKAPRLGDTAELFEHGPEHDTTIEGAPDAVTDAAQTTIPITGEEEG